MTQYLNGQTKVEDDTAIREILSDFSNAWNKHDAKIFSMIFSEDADFTNIRGNSFKGRIEIESHHAPIFSTRFKESNIRTTQINIRFIKPDVAAVDACWEMTGVKDAEGKDITEKGLLNFIAIKVNGRWLISVLHNMSLPE